MAWIDIERFKPGTPVTAALANALLGNAKAIRNLNYAITQYAGTEGNFSTSVSAQLQLGDLEVDLTVTGGDVIVIAQYTMQRSSTGYSYFSIQRDGDPADGDQPDMPFFFTVASMPITIYHWKPFHNVQPGTHTFRVYGWLYDGTGSMTMIDDYRPFVMAMEGN